MSRPADLDLGAIGFDGSLVVTSLTASRAVRFKMGPRKHIPWESHVRSMFGPTSRSYRAVDTTSNSLVRHSLSAAIKSHFHR
jgi:hypothetical protein